VMICQIPSRQQYQIVRQVGEGSAVVYQARTDEAGLPRTVALKVTTIGRALHEARILSSLQHPSIPRFYDLVVDDTEACVVMEFIEGETLSQYLDSYLAQGDLPPVQQVLGMGIQLCAVLDYLHTQQPALTFRDVKPENVMLSADGRLVLIDYDISCAHVAMWDTDFPAAGRDPIVLPTLRCLRTGCHPVPPADGPSPADGHEGSRPGSCLWTPPPAVAAGAAVDDRARSTVPPCQYGECQDGARADTPLPEDEQHVGELAEKHTGCVAKIRGGRRWAQGPLSRGV